jgi:2-polyprenyl-3-methyl-5-hydroxy-6-metoxy-1,4-benzoquinol methylase
VPLFLLDISKRAAGEELFDAVSCLNSLEHIKDDLSALANMRKMLSPGGLLAIAVPLSPDIFDM